MNGDTPVPPAASKPQGPKPAPPPAEPEAGWQYKTESAPAPAANSQPLFSSSPSGPQETTWSASEFIDHDKGIGWYAALGGGALAMDVLLYFWTHDFISIVAVTTMAVLLGVMGSRKPRVLDYRLDTAGLTIGQTFHPYSEFKSFAIMDDGALQSITFYPLKRVMPPISIFYDPEDEEKITGVLSQHLPVEIRERDAVDRLSRRIRF